MKIWAGEGGIYNTVNFSVHHYAGNNPVKYTDLDGFGIFNLIQNHLRMCLIGIIFQ